MSNRRPLFIVLLLSFFVPSASTGVASDRDYNPLSVSQAQRFQTLDFDVRDKNRDREIPIRIYLPSGDSARPVVLFSHGLGGSRNGSAYLGKHWAKRGYITVFLQHPGSDASVWKDAPVRKRLDAMKDAASVKNFFARVRDVPSVLDQLEKWNSMKDHTLSRRLDLDRVGMSGHSFGAITTQAVSGQSFLNLEKPFTDRRIKAAVIFSPSTLRLSGEPKDAFGNVPIPWMLMTGTRDLSFIGKATIESRLSVFPALPRGGKYELVLYNAEHSAFTDRRLPGDTQPRNPNHYRAILALSTAFWDAWLSGDSKAKAWLDGAGAKSVLEEKDRWQRK